MSSNPPSPAESAVEEAVARIMEHCDSVRIIATVHYGGDEVTSIVTSGGGNFYAQMASTLTWVDIQREVTRRHAGRNR